MSPGNLSIDLEFSSTLSNTDHFELLIYMTAGIRIGGGREVLGQETLKKTSVHLLISNFINNNLC